MSQARYLPISVFLAEARRHSTSKDAPRKVGWSARALFGSIRSPFWWVTIHSRAGAALACPLFCFYFLFFGLRVGQRMGKQQIGPAYTDTGL